MTKNVVVDRSFKKPAFHAWTIPNLPLWLLAKYVTFSELYLLSRIIWTSLTNGQRKYPNLKTFSVREEAFGHQWVLIGCWWWWWWWWLKKINLRIVQDVWCDKWTGRPQVDIINHYNKYYLPLIIQQRVIYNTTLCATESTLHISSMFLCLHPCFT